MNNKGFTLIELIIVLSVSAMVGLLLISMLVQNSGLFYIQNSRVIQGVGENDALSSFRTYTKVSKAVALSYPETGSAIYTSGSSILILKLGSIDSSGNLIDNVFDYVVYYVSQNKLYIKIYPGTGSSRQAVNKILADNVDALNFTYLDATNLAVSPSSATKVIMRLTLRQKAGTTYEINIATSEANLRND